MKHPLFLFVPISLAGTALAAGTYLLLKRGFKRPRPLSAAATSALRTMEQFPTSFAVKQHIFLSCRDIVSLYSNSRLIVFEAHRLKLLCPEDGSIQAGYELAEDRHGEILLLAGMFLWCKPMMYFSRRKMDICCKAILWTFAELVAILDEMALQCGDIQATELVGRF